MKNIKYSITLVIALVCAMLFTACDYFFEPQDSNTPTESGYGKISISFAGVEVGPQQARTILPSMVFYKFTYTFIKTGETTGVELLPDNEGYFILEIGNYTVEVQAFTGNAETYTLTATGVSSEFTVGSDSNDPVEVILTAVSTATHGEFSYTITYPAGATAEITLQKWPGLDGITLSPINLSEGNGKTQTLQLETGYYLLSVLVSKTGLYAGTNEAVHIYPSLTTVYTKNYVDSDFLAKFPGAAVTAPTLNDATQNSITINPVNPPGNGQTVEYGINTSNTAPSTWQTDLTFADLSGGVYYVFARSVENDDYATGTVSGNLLAMIVTTTAHWNNTLTAIGNSGNGISGNPKIYTIAVFGDVAVSGVTATSFSSVQYIVVTLKGSGTLSLSSNGSILRLGSNQTLIIDDENLTLQGRSGNSYAVMYVQSGSSLELKNGAISGNTSSSSGSGVYVVGTFTMSGGEISGNTASSSYSTGGGVYIYSSGRFTMSRGTISGNTAYRGGGVYVDNSCSFTMTGGIVYGSDADPPLANTATFNGAALYNSNGTARYGDSSNILPHTDNQSSYTNNTIIPGISGGSPAADFNISGTGSFTYDGSAKTVSISPKENVSPGQITVFYNGTDTLPVNVGTYAVTFNVAAAPGFNAMTIRAGTITITRANGAAVSAPTGTSSVTGTSITINSVTAPANGQTVEYARNTTNSAPSSGWQTDTTFSGLNAGTTYYFFARSAQNTNYNAGAASGSLTVTTPQTVSEYYWVNEHGSLVTSSGGAATIFQGQTLTITPQGTGYDVKQWHLNGLNTGQSGNTYTFSGIAAGKHIVGLFVEKDGKPYNTNITITVVLGFTVTFSVNGSNGTTPSAQTIVAGSSITLPSGSGLTRSGYIFDGWNTSAFGTGTNYNAGSSYMPTENITLYAKWLRIVTIDMFATGGGWGGGELRINVNGVQVATRTVSDYSNIYTLYVTTGDVVQLDWVAGSSQGQAAASFIVYYDNKPPSPAFTPSNNNSWNGTNALIYKLRGTMSSTLGSFTVE